MYWILPLSLINEVRNQLTRLIKSDPKTADQNPFTPNPDTRPDTINSMMAFKTKVKNPKVTMVIGSVSINKMGRKNAFKIPRNAAAKNAEKKPLTYIPSIR